MVIIIWVCHMTMGDWFQVIYDTKSLSIYERHKTMIFQGHWAYFSDQPIKKTAVGLQENYQALGVYHISVDLFRHSAPADPISGISQPAVLITETKTPWLINPLFRWSSLYLMVKSLFSVVKSLFFMVKSAFLMFYCKVSPLRRCSLFRSSSGPLQLQRHFGSLQPWDAVASGAPSDAGEGRQNAGISPTKLGSKEDLLRKIGFHQNLGISLDGFRLWGENVKKTRNDQGGYHLSH